MDVRHVIVNNTEFKIERKRSYLSDEFFYLVTKAVLCQDRDFKTHEWAFQCSLDTLKDSLIKASRGKLLI